MSESELYHYGVKGMKWGVRRVRRDSSKLSKAAKEYYTQVNRRNAYLDLGEDDKTISQMDKLIKKGHRETQKIVKKLERKYGSGNVSVLPEFEKNGYTVKRFDTLVKKLDRNGREVYRHNSSTPVDTYSDYREAAKRINDARKPIDAKYKKMLREAKTDDERDMIQMDYDFELDRIRYGT